MLGKPITLFKLFGFDIKIDLSWIFIVLLITWSLATGYFPYKVRNLSQASYWYMGMCGALGLFVSILLHELGHALVARKFGIPIKGVTLFIFGGVSEMEEEPPTAKSEFGMAIAGPVVSFLVALAFYPLYTAGYRLGWSIQLTLVMYYLSWINALLGAFNLIPAFPLDGGRLLRSYLWSRKGNLQSATRISSRIGSGFGLGLIFLGILSLFQGSFVGGLWWCLIGMFLRYASGMSYRQLEIREALEGESISRFMQPTPVTVPPWISVEDLVQDYIYKYHYRMFPVTRDSTILGCITMQRVKELPRAEWSRHSVQELITPCSKENAISPAMDAVHVLSTMNGTGNSRLMVVDQDRLVGVVTLKDLLHFLSLKVDLEGVNGSSRNTVRKSPSD